MLENLKLTRPLAVIDLETTGKYPKIDRIVEISVLKIMPDGTSQQHTRRLNPQRPIPPDATAVHGITDADVAGEKTFDEVADNLVAYLDSCDLCGFNLKSFDLPMLCAEFARVGRSVSFQDRAVIDPKEIFHAYEPRDLSAAVRFYLGVEHQGAHTAEADVMATARILDAMLTRYADLPQTVADLHVRFKDPNAVDIDRKFIRMNGEIYFNFGPHRGQPIKAVAKDNAGFFRWMLNGDFQEDAKAICREVLAKLEAPSSAT